MNTSFYKKYIKGELVNVDSAKLPSGQEYDFEKIKYSTENLTYCPTALSYIEKDSRVYYMGFGFSPENVSRIPFDIRTKIVKATAIGISKSDEAQIKSQINQLNFQRYSNSDPSMDFEFHNINCDQMIKNYLTL
jgi:hypothetical protein